MAAKVPELSDLTKEDLLRLIARLQDRYLVRIEPRDIARVLYDRYLAEYERLRKEYSQKWDEYMKGEQQPSPAYRSKEYFDSVRRQTDLLQQCQTLEQRIDRMFKKAMAMLDI